MYFIATIETITSSTANVNKKNGENECSKMNNFNNAFGQLLAIYPDLYDKHIGIYLNWVINSYENTTIKCSWLRDLIM